MDIEQARERLRVWMGRISYKHSVKFNFEIPDYHGPVCLNFLCYTIDSNDKKTPVKIGHNNFLSLDEFWPMNFERFVRWVSHCLWKMERHEMDEFFRVDGKILNDPHKSEER